VAADSSNVFLPILANDSALPFPTLPVLVTNIAVAPNNGGSVTIATDGSGVRYTPLTNFIGVETFTYGIADGLGGIDTAIVRIRVAVQTLNGNLAAGDDVFTIGKGTPAVLPVLANDNTIPLAGADLTIVAADAPLEIVSDGKALRFQPAAGFTGPAVFQYTVSAGGTARATASVSINVIDRTGLLTANPDLFRVAPAASNISLDVLANDNILPGANGSRKITSITTVPPDSTFINAERDRIVYTPPGGFAGTQLITYQITDGAGGTATATASVIVSAPSLIANPDRFTAYRGSSQNRLAVLLNDTGTPGSTAGFTISDVGIDLDAPDQGGRVTIASPSGGLSYTPDLNYAGAYPYFESFKYEISDGSLNRSEGTAVVEVIDRSGVLSPNPDHFTVAEDTGSAQLVVLANDLAFPSTGEVWTVAAATSPLHGTASIAAGGRSVIYTPVPGFVGEDTFSYAVADGRGGTGSTTVTIDVGDLPADEDKFNVLSDSTNNVLEVLNNDGVLPAGSGQFTVISAGTPALARYSTRPIPVSSAPTPSPTRSGIASAPSRPKSQSRSTLGAPTGQQPRSRSRSTVSTIVPPSPVSVPQHSPTRA
jgi:hypothetical protein